MAKDARRLGDMNPDRRLRIIAQDDGDIIVAITHQNVIIQDSDLKERPDACVEFCTLGSGGGRSKHTRKALFALLEAIEKDNKENSIEPAK